MKLRLKDIVIFNLKFLFAVALIVYLVNSGNFSLQRLQTLLNLRAIGPGVILMGLILFTASLRFKVLSISNISIWQSFKLTLIGIFFNFFVPGGVGGDLVKGVMMKKSTEASGGEAAFVVILDRVLGLATMSALSVLAFLFVPHHLTQSSTVRLLAFILLGLFLSILIFLGLLVSSRVRDRLIMGLSAKLPMWIRNKMEDFHFKQKQKSYNWSALIRASLWSIVSQMTSIYFFIYLSSILLPDLSVPIFLFFFVVPVGFMLTAVPISPGGVGVGQAAFLYLFQRALNIETDFGAISVSGFQFYQLIWGLLGAYFFIFLKKSELKS
jgi:uncharacterized protein (TIRG00374 family)